MRVKPWPSDLGPNPLSTSVMRPCFEPLRIHSAAYSRMAENASKTMRKPTRGAHLIFLSVYCGFGATDADFPSSRLPPKLSTCQKK